MTARFACALAFVLLATSTLVAAEPEQADEEILEPLPGDYKNIPGEYKRIHQRALSGVLGGHTEKVIAD
ncbi:MAG: hypothetical protein KDA41_12375, partial [Planctomycetales bacterium]|nr:hypothetical protein [Planctomycetales bacterium]